MVTRSNVPITGLISFGILVLVFIVSSIFIKKRRLKNKAKFNKAMDEIIQAKKQKKD